MSTPKVIVVTGVAGYWGGRVAIRLSMQPAYRVFGLADQPVLGPAAGLDTLQTHLANPALAELFTAEGVDTLCHLDFVPSQQPNDAAYEANVIGLGKLLAAAGQAGLRRVILTTSTTVYGARPDNPAFIRENQPLRGRPSHGYNRDWREQEAVAQAFTAKYPATSLTLLRLAPIIGPTADTPLTRFLKDRLALPLLGFDPLMQVLHEDDAVAAILQAIAGEVTGPCNIAAAGVLPLTRLLGLAGKIVPPALHPLVYTLWQNHTPLEPDYLRYACVADLTRMREELGFSPRYTAEEAAREFAGSRRPQPAGDPPDLEAEAAQLRNLIAERQHQAGDLLIEPAEAAGPAGEEEI